MDLRKLMTLSAAACAATLLTAGSLALADDDHGRRDFGLMQEQLLAAHSDRLFGFKQPIERTATADDIIERELAGAADRQFLARGLKAEFVTRNVAVSGDMIAFWPTDTHYSHLIVCIEQGRSGTTPGGNGGQNAAIQRINARTGLVDTILYGMSRCDGIRTTQWGTILATEEAGADGGAYEIIEPLTTTRHWVVDRGAPGAPADIRDAVDSPNASTRIVKRTTLAAQSWEGLEVLDNGVVIGGDELRPDDGQDGGAIFRFVPTVFYACEGAPVRPGQLCTNTISNLADSPLVSGKNYALSNVCSGSGNFGQGCEGGRGLWVEVNAATARADAAERGATGFCRPEDLHVDRSHGEFDGGDGIRWCWNNTCAIGTGETLCVTEKDMDANVDLFSNSRGQNLLSTDGVALAEVNVTRFVDGDNRLRAHDNLDIQPMTSNVYVIEDAPFGEVWACLPDGADRDFRTDGCVAVLSIRDPSAEPTGFIFDGTGNTAYYILQHGQQPAALLDFGSNPVNGRTDDLVKITGFKTRETPDKHL